MNSHELRKHVLSDLARALDGKEVGAMASRTELERRLTGHMKSDKDIHDGYYRELEALVREGYVRKLPFKDGTPGYKPADVEGDYGLLAEPDKIYTKVRYELSVAPSEGLSVFQLYNRRCGSYKAINEALKQMHDRGEVRARVTANSRGEAVRYSQKLNRKKESV